MDFKNPRLVFPVASAGCLILLLGVTSRHFLPSPAEPVEPPEILTEPEEVVEADPDYLTYEETIPRRTTLQEILSRYDFTNEQIHTLLVETRDVYNLNRIRAGHQFAVDRYLDGTLRSFRYQISDEEFLEVDFREDRLTANRRIVEFDVIVEEIFGEIHDSLWNTLVSGGESDRLVMDLLQILRWDVDFTAVQRGDSFKLIVEKKYLDDRFVKYGDILAAQFASGDKSFSGILFVNPENGAKEYFDLEGKAVKKAFLKVPFHFNPRISSGFSHSRFHPVLKRHRPHLGVDYAAPAGTPVLASGSGTVIFAGTRGGYGKMVQIRHPNGFVTSYSHLSSFGVRSGQRVAQGQQIGRVGATGLATGPHLDYRVQNRRGQFLDPRQLITLPSEEAVDPAHMSSFEAIRDDLLVRLGAIPEDEPFLSRVSIAG